MELLPNRVASRVHLFDLYQCRGWPLIVSDVWSSFNGSPKSGFLTMINGYVLILLMPRFKKFEPWASRRSTSSVALCIYDESIMQGDRDVPSCYRVQQLARADALGYCARWCADGHRHRHVRHAHRAHDA